MSECLELPEKLNSDAASDLLKALRQKKGAKLEIEAGKVRFLGGLCFQLLVAARDEWRADDETLVFGETSAAFKDGMARLGMPVDVFSGGN